MGIVPGIKDLLQVHSATEECLHREKTLTFPIKGQQKGDVLTSILRKLIF